MTMPNTLILTEAESEALFEAAEYVRKHRWSQHDRLTDLNSAIRKLRRAEAEAIAAAMDAAAIRALKKGQTNDDN